MKINKIFSVMKKEKEILLQNSINNTQWIGTTKAIYQLSNLPRFEAQNIFSLMGENEAKIEKYTVYEGGFNVTLDDVCGLDKDILQHRISIRSGEVEIVPFRTSDGLVYVDSKYLAPIYDMQQLRFYERDGFISVKSGMFCYAIIEPIRILNREAVEELESLAECSRAKYEYYTRGEKKI